jgi:ABC-type transport system, involved in lipoprotein release, permease component
MILHYLKIVFRGMRNYKTQSVINITGLAIGFTAFALAGYWYLWEHSFDTFHPQWERTYAITTSGLSKISTGEEKEINQLHESDVQVLMSNSFVEKSCLIQNWNPMIEVGNKPERFYGYKVDSTFFPVFHSGFLVEINQLHESDAKVLMSHPFVEKSCQIQMFGGASVEVGGKQERLYGYKVDSTFFSVFHSDFLEGNVYKISYNNEYVVLTRSLAMQLFGSVKCVGEVIKIGNSPNVKVAAVMEDYPGNTELLFNILLLSDDRKYNPRGRATSFVVLNSGKDEVPFGEIVRNHKSLANDPSGTDLPQRWKYNLRSLPELHFLCNQSLNERFRNINILFWTGFLLLLCALMNNLVLFIGQQQYKLKKNITYISLGAKRTYLFIRYLLNLMVPVLISYLLALVILEIVYPMFNDFTTIRSEANTILAGYIRSMEFGILLMESAKYTVIYIAAYLLLSLFPIMHFIRNSVNSSGNGSSVHIRRILIAGQIFIGSLFLISSISMYKQLNFLKNTPKGIEMSNVMQVYLGYNTTQNTDMELVKSRLLQLSEVEDVTLTADPLLMPDGRFNYEGLLWVDGRDTEKARLERDRDNIFQVQDNFFDFFGIKFIEGRAFTNEDGLMCVINETGAKNIGLDNLLQRTTNKGTGRISGIIGDYHYSPMRYPIQTVVFRLLDNKNFNYQYIYIKTSNKDISRIEEIISEFDKGEVSKEDSFVRLTDVEDEFNRPDTTIFLIFVVFALLCIIISSFGIYSLVALSAEQRKKEIAIRKVNGAIFKDILRLFLKEYLALVIIGNLFALPAGYFFINRWLESYAYHTETGLGLFLLVFVITCGIVILSVARQVKSASDINAAESIKCE